jgi:hypothetical protein
MLVCKFAGVATLVTTMTAPRTTESSLLRTTVSSLLRTTISSLLRTTISSLLESTVVARRTVEATLRRINTVVTVAALLRANIDLLGSSIVATVAILQSGQSLPFGVDFDVHAVDLTVQFCGFVGDEGMECLPVTGSSAGAQLQYHFTDDVPRIPALSLENG